MNRNSSFLGDESPRTAPQPVGTESQPDFPASIPLNFNIDTSIKSNFGIKNSYHYASSREARILNRYSDELQKSANWYLDELSGNNLIYFYQEKDDLKSLQISFEKHHWMHLTGIYPIYQEKNEVCF
ncbi:PBECR4 domain-containing protein [Streptococcus sp. DD10]|uniref:PBECR4 domain-containing protein n=1 Tax=Streptococcus sp. DD10 TaxID=1777878 RepID=UPI003FA6E4AB